MIGAFLRTVASASMLALGCAQVQTAAAEVAPSDLADGGTASGIRCDGVSDDAPAIRAALARLNPKDAKAPGGRPAMRGDRTLRLPGPVCLVRSTISAPMWSGVHLLGVAAGDGGRSATTITYAGPPTPDPVIDLTSRGDGDYTSGFEMRGIEINAAGLAGTCVLIRSMTSSRIDGICDNPTRVGWDIDVAPGAGAYGSTVKNHFDITANIAADQLSIADTTSGSSAVTLSAANAGITAGMWIIGASMPFRARVAAVNGTALTIADPSGLGATYSGRAVPLSFYKNEVTGVLLGRGAEVGTHLDRPDVNSNTFDSITVIPGAGPAIDCGAADGNLFQRVLVTGGFGSGTTVPVAGAGVALRLEGAKAGRAGAESDACHHNRFVWLQAFGRVVAENGALVAQATLSGRQTGSLLTVEATNSGTLAVGQVVTGVGLPLGDTILAKAGDNPLRYAMSKSTGRATVAGPFAAGRENAYPAQANLMTIGTGDSFTFLDVSNAGTASVGSESGGNNQPNTLNAAETDTGVLINRGVAGLNFTGVPGVSSFRQTGFTGRTPAGVSFNIGPPGKPVGVDNAMSFAAPAGSSRATIDFGESFNNPPLCIGNASSGNLVPTFTGSRTSATITYPAMPGAGGGVYLLCF